MEHATFRANQYTRFHQRVYLANNAFKFQQKLHWINAKNEI